MSFSEPNFQKPLEEMEDELNPEPSDRSETVFPHIEINPSPQVKQLINRGQTWFRTLPKFGQAAVVLGGIWLGFSILGALLHVVSSILSIAALGAVLYVGYRLFRSEDSAN